MVVIGRGDVPRCVSMSTRDELAEQSVRLAAERRRI